MFSVRVLNEYANEQPYFDRYCPHMSMITHLWRHVYFFLFYIVHGNNVSSGLLNLRFLFFCVFFVSKGNLLDFYFYFTAADAVSCGDRKTSPHTLS